MKIAIPTVDGIRVARKFEHAKGFLVLTVITGEIQDEELRWNSQNDVPSSDDNLLDTVSDCSLVIVNEGSQGFLELLESKLIPFIHTREDIITNIIIHYLENECRKESNTLCCP